MVGQIYIDGEICAPKQARISVFDRGFLYGDSVYEVMRVYDGKPFAVNDHLLRLQASGVRIGFNLAWSLDDISNAVYKTLDASELHNAYIRVMATRGTGTIGLDPSLAENPSLIVMVLPLPDLPSAIYQEGRSAWLVSVSRNLKSAIDPMAKTGNYINNVMALREAREQGAHEAIMLDHLGRVAEGSSSNIFVLINGVWLTPPLEVGILPGITRQTLLNLCLENQLPVKEEIIFPEQLAQAEEMFVCSSVREIVPIVKLNNLNIGVGKVGDETKRLMDRYKLFVRS